MLLCILRARLSDNGHVFFTVFLVLFLTRIFLVLVFRFHINQRQRTRASLAAVLGVQGEMTEPRLLTRQVAHLRMSEAEAKRPEARRVERVMAPLAPDGHEYDDDG